jgi:hypothetical protein
LSSTPADDQLHGARATVRIEYRLRRGPSSNHFPLIAAVHKRLYSHGVGIVTAEDLARYLTSELIAVFCCYELFGVAVFVVLLDAVVRVGGGSARCPLGPVNRSVLARP